MRAAATGADGDPPPIVFQGYADGTTAILLGDADWAAPVALTGAVDAAHAPSICPDRRTIVFDTTRQDGATRAIGVQRGRTGAVRLLTLELMGHEMAPACAVAGGVQIIAFMGQAAGEGFDIYTMRDDGSAITRLTDDPAIDTDPTWCGERIVWASSRAAGGGDYELYSMDPRGGDVVQLTDNDVADRQPSCSPDGTRLAFARGADGAADVIVRELRTGAERNLTPGTEASNDTEPAWSPDGARLACASDRDDGDGVKEHEIYTIDARDGSAVRQVTFNETDDRAPDWRALD